MPLRLKNFYQGFKWQLTKSFRSCSRMFLHQWTIGQQLWLDILIGIYFSSIATTIGIAHWGKQIFDYTKIESNIEFEEKAKVILTPTRWSAIPQNNTSLSPLLTSLLIRITLPMLLFNTSFLKIADELAERFSKNKFYTKRYNWPQHFMPFWSFT